MSMKKLLLSVLFVFVLVGCKNNATKEKKETAEELTAAEIMQKAHERAGGEFWKRPQSLTLKGYGLFYRNGKVVKHEKHNMWRVFDTVKANAHKANGKVRIESFKEGNPVFMVSYDGKNTYDLNGKQEPSAADNRWSSNFGYGAIRHAFDEGYQLQLMADDTIANKPVYQIKVIDQNQGETFFGIDQEDFKIVKVAFDTPRGWHHRIYSNFFEKEEYNWVQSGKVALYYNNVLANEIFWEDFEVNETLPDALFVLETNSNKNEE